MEAEGHGAVQVMTLTDAYRIAIAAIKAEMGRLETQAELTNRHREREPLANMAGRAQAAILLLDAELIVAEKAERELPHAP